MWKRDEVVFEVMDEFRMVFPSGSRVSLPHLGLEDEVIRVVEVLEVPSFLGVLVAGERGVRCGGWSWRLWQCCWGEDGGAGGETPLWPLRGGWRNDGGRPWARFGGTRVVGFLRRRWGYFWFPMSVALSCFKCAHRDIKDPVQFYGRESRVKEVGCGVENPGEGVGGEVRGSVDSKANGEGSANGHVGFHPADR